jgi:hypothetical protein
VLTQPTRTNRMGYDAGKGEYVDAIKSGIVNPLKVVWTALVDAAGVTSLPTTSEVSIVKARNKNLQVAQEWVPVAWVGWAASEPCSLYYMRILLSADISKLR